MKHLVFPILAVLMATPAEASEMKLSGSEITNLLKDRTLFAGASGEIEQIFQATGATIYSEKSATSIGHWKIENDQYCSAWPPSELWSCYDVFQDDETIVFVGKSGNRFPMRETKQVK
jgi:hypothetical protein